MTLLARPFPRLRSAALLLAGLLHLLSIPAEPVVHGWLHASAYLPGWSAGDASDPGAPQHHADQTCVVCQGINDHALPEPDAGSVVVAVLLHAPPALGEALPSSVARAQLQARAPPA